VLGRHRLCITAKQLEGGDVPQSEKVRIRLQALDERLARLRMEKNRLIARVSQTQRKRDTRRKILIGGAVLAAIDHEGVPSLRSIAELLNWLDGRLLRPHDRAVFDLTPHETTRGSLQPSADNCQRARSGAAVKDADHGEAPRSGAERP
jgi:hypothetical protein